MANLRRAGGGFANRAVALLVGVAVLEWVWVTLEHGLRGGQRPGPAPVAGSRPLEEGGEENYGVPIWSVAFSPDGRYLAWVVMTGEVWLRDRSTGEISTIQEGVTASARALAFSPDSRVLAVAGEGPRIRLWEVPTRSELESLDVGGEATKSVAFAPDGIAVAIGQASDGGGVGGVITVWDLADRRRLAVLAGHRGGVNTLAFSPDVAFLASGDSRGIVKFWDLGLGRERNTLEVGDCCVKAVAFSADGRMLAACRAYGLSVRLWDTASGQPRGELPTVSGVHSLAVSPDGKWLVTGESHGIAAVWDLGLRRKLGVVRSEGANIYSLAFSSDGARLATGDEAGGLRLWEFPRAFADDLEVGG